MTDAAHDQELRPPGTARSLLALLALTFRADPIRAVIAVIPGIALLEVVPAYLSKVLIDAILAGERTTVFLAAGAAAGSALAAIILALTTFQVSMRLREAVSLRLDTTLIEEAGSAATTEHFERPAYADRMELLRMHRDTLISGVFALSQGSQVVVALATTLVLLGGVHPLLLLLPVAGLPILVVTAHTQQRIEEALEQTAETDRRALHLFDLSTAPDTAKELRIFGLGGSMQHRYHQAWTSVDDRRTRAWIRANLARGGASLFFTAAFVATVGFVIALAARGQATVGDVVMTSALARQITGNVQGTAGTIAMALNVGRSMSRYLWLVDYAAHVRRRTIPARRSPCPTRIERGITLRQVGFRYPGAADAALRGVNLHLPAGATVALVGDNGAGKSTLVKLLCRFYDPTEGAILVDDLDLRDIPVDEWRQRLSAGYQDFARYQLVAHETVGVGDVNRVGDREAAFAALDRAAATDVVDALPAGLDTHLGADFGGSDLSGGQWQKLALGRALMRTEPLLLLLDEPTAAIDAETEHRLFERYAAAARETAQRTGGITLLVSHRFSTVRMADLIVVIDGGTVREAGSHRELMNGAGLYAELYELQARAYR